MVRLEYDSGPKRSLKWFRNGVLIHEETQVSPGMHFAVGRWAGSSELRLNPSPKADSIKSSKKKKDLSRARPSVGDSVKIIAASHTSCEPHVGQKGVLIQDDNSGRPFNVKFDGGSIWWFKDDEVVGLGSGSDSSSPLNVGDRVRVKKSIASPKYGWGGVSHSHVGTITRIPVAHLKLTFQTTQAGMGRWMR